MATVCSEYADDNEIRNKFDLIWWVKEIIQCQDKTILKEKLNYWCTSHEVDISVPNTVKEAYGI